MIHAIARAAVGAALLVLAACGSVHHNIPVNPVSAGAPVDRITLFADANGHLYPDRWRLEPGPPEDDPSRFRFDGDEVEERHSLLSSRNRDPLVHAFLRRERDRQLGEAARRLDGRRRVFILVHGFNNSQAEARQAYDVVLGRLPAPHGDGVVEFHWDGLVSTSSTGQLGMWFKAAGYSQLAGTQALRGLLRALGDKEIVIVAHSRGASVTLSALSDPAYSPRFRLRTEAILGSDYESPSLPPEGGGDIHVLFLAPAIGNPDFWRPETTPAAARDARPEDRCRLYRDFPRRLRSIHYSVNPDDPVLSKIFPRLASSFNATDLGRDEGVGRVLAVCYAGRVAMVRYDFPMPHHSFVDYAMHPELGKMLRAVGVADAR